MSYLHGSTLPKIHTLHNDPTTSRQRRKSEARNQTPSLESGLISPLLRLFRDPIGNLEEFVERVWTKPPPDPSTLFINNDDQETRILLLQHRMQTAEDYSTWHSAATELDQIDGVDAWKQDPVSDHYDYKLLQVRLEELNHARISGDPKRMLFLLRTSLTRGLANMGDARLYKNTRVGTKKLIDDYISAACDTMDKFMELMNSSQSCGIDRRDALQQLLNARQAFGRSALLLSGGGTWGMTHIGVVRTLWETGLLPRIVCGSSAGSIICSVLCSKTDYELEETLLEMCTGDLDVFEKSGEEENFLRKAARLAKHGCLFDISHLTRVMKGLLGDLTFQEAYYRTGRLLNIAVSGSGLHELPRLLNYVTAPNVIIWSAVIASCSVPLIFEPITLMAKDQKTGEHIPWSPNPEQMWIDGSVDADLPMTKLSEMFNVNHFIVSQVNPHVIPFLAGDSDVFPSKGKDNSSGMTATSVATTWLNNIASIAKSEAAHRMHILSEMGIFPNYHTKMRSIMSQKYAGDITILPNIGFSQFPLILKNPTPVFMLNSMLTGMRATWPHFARIQNHCAIELALDKMTQELRTHIVFSPSQVDLRLASLAPRSAAPPSGSKRRPRHRAKTKSWCADTPYGLAAQFQMTPERSSANDVHISSEWNTGAETELTAHESFSEDDDEDDREFLSFGKLLRKKTKNNKPSFPLSEPASPPHGTPTAATFSQSLKRLFPNGSQPGTPRVPFQSLSSIIGDLKSSDNQAAQAEKIRWAMSPSEDYLDGKHSSSDKNLHMTKSMLAEAPAEAQGVSSQVERKNATLASQSVDGGDQLGRTQSDVPAHTSLPANSGATASLPTLDTKSIRNMIKRKKGSSGAAR